MPLGGATWSFQVLLQGQLHNPAMSGDLSLFSFPMSAECTHYMDDVMLTCGDVSLLQDTAEMVSDKVQAHPTPKNVKRVQVFVRIWDLGRTFIPHWAQHLCLYAT